MPTMRCAATVFALALVTLSACGSDDRPSPMSSTGGSSQETEPSFCKAYCSTLVDEAPGCETYNDDTRCERICGFYMASVCRDPYEQFATCMREPGSASCSAPSKEPTEGPNDGRPTLNVHRCHVEYDDWNQCITDENAGYCPY